MSDRVRAGRADPGELRTLGGEHAGVRPSERVVMCLRGDEKRRPPPRSLRLQGGGLPAMGRQCTRIVITWLHGPGPLELLTLTFTPTIVTEGSPTRVVLLDEIERRARSAIAGSPGIPWEDARAEIERRLQRVGH